MSSTSVRFIARANQVSIAEQPVWVDKPRCELRAQARVRFELVRSAQMTEERRAGSVVIVRIAKMSSLKRFWGGRRKWLTIGKTCVYR